MRVPIKWLRDYVDPRLAPEELAHRLTMAGLEAEKTERTGAGWDHVYVGFVHDVRPHPNADRLVLADVSAGEHRLTVVTGAPNVAAGQKVAIALAGARLWDTHSETPQLKTLKPGMLRGVKSEGMVCSEKELGLSDEHEGILVLDPGAPEGVPLADWLGDTVVEFEITPNLVHAFSVRGIAREAAAVTGQPLDEPPRFDLDAAPPGAGDLVRIDAPDLCPRYAAVVIEGIAVAPSPDWLARRLTAAGLRPINNVVDVTNYVMLELGQPLHAFDRANLRGGRIVVRRAGNDEPIETLDHQQRRLDGEMLVIADAERAVAVAGVMGGVDSEVSAATTTVLLESANFGMASVRRTARLLKLRTDASARFERGLDPNLASDAAARATHLLLDLCPGSRVTAARDVYPSPVVPWAVRFPFSRFERVVGIAYPPEQVVSVLERLGFGVALPGGAGGDVIVTVPTHRTDVTIAEDVIEEVARIVGYEGLPDTLPAGRTPPVFRDPIALLQRRVRAALVGAGCYEAITYVSVSESMLAPFDSIGDRRGLVLDAPAADLLRLVNPMPGDRPILRPTLIPSLLERVAENLKHAPSVRLCELARVYLPTEPDALPREANVAAITLSGRREPLSRFAADPLPLDFFDVKGVVDAALAAAGAPEVEYRPFTHGALHPGRAAEACVGQTRVGVLGELHPRVAAGFGIENGRVAVAELDLDALLALGGDRSPVEVRVPKFLPVSQDFAVVVAKQTPAAEVERALRQAAGPLLTDLALFDVFAGEQIGDDKKSLTFRLTFASPDRALTDAELTKTRGKIEKTLAQRVGGSLRG